MFFFSMVENVFFWKNDPSRSSLVKKPLKFKLILAVFVTYYERWHQLTNWSSIEILIKINLEKALKLDFLDTFLEKMFLLGISEFHGLHDDLKLYEKSQPLADILCRPKLNLKTGLIVQYVRIGWIILTWFLKSYF